MEQKQLSFRNLTKDEIEVRVGGGNSLLLYKTARVDAKVLDETVGAFNWQKRFYQVKNTMICAIAINMNYNDPTKEPIWVEKADAGDDDYTMEKIKAEASDSFKRAGFAWGIGRNLYTAPKIKLDEKFKGKQYFDVESIGYNEKGEINELTISTDFGKTIVFSYKNGRKVAQTSQKPTYTGETDNMYEDSQPITPKQEEQITKFQDYSSAKGSITAHDKTVIQAYLETTDKNGQDKFFTYIDTHYNTMSIESLSEIQGVQLVNMLNARKGK